VRNTEAYAIFIGKMEARGQFGVSGFQMEDNIKIYLGVRQVYFVTGNLEEFIIYNRHHMSLPDKKN
jgi:hypothetical protein